MAGKTEAGIPPDLENEGTYLFRFKKSIGPMPDKANWQERNAKPRLQPLLEHQETGAYGKLWGHRIEVQLDGKWQDLPSMQRKSAEMKRISDNAKRARGDSQALRAESDRRQVEASRK